MPATLPGNAVITAKKFGSLNTKADRSAIGDEEFSWIENWMQIGDGNLRTLAGEGAALYTASGKTVSYYFPYNIGATAYIAVFLSDFSAVQVRVSDGATTTIGSGLFSATGLPACSQYGSKYLLITSPLASTNAYWVWDGSLLYGPGTLAPIVTVTNGGRNYASAPTVTFYGGSGTGATATAAVDTVTGVVTSVTITNPGGGYISTDLPVIGFSGGGSDTTAILTPSVDHTSAGVAYCIVTNSGNNYSAATYITFAASGGGGVASGVLSMVNGQIIGVTITNPATGYTSPPVVTIHDPASTPGSGGAITAVIEAGQVVGATITVAGTGYKGQPTVKITGDGTGAAAHVTLTAGVVTAVVMDNPGLGYTFAKMEVSGSNAAAAAEVGIMPFGVSGTTVETYQDRVWIANGINTLFTAAESVSDFGTSDGGGAFPSVDSHLRVSITRYAATSSFLYGFGDSSINAISNVQTSGSPATTTFSNDNVDVQVGAAWRDTVVPFGRALVFANTSGVYALYGGAAEKVSAALDGLFLNADFSTLTPTAAVATIYSIRVYMLLFRTTDPFGVTRNILAMWDGQKWFVGSQVATLTQVALQEINSTLTAWGCDGTHIYPLFQTPTTSLTKKWQGKLFDEDSLFYSKQANRAYLHAKNNDSGGTATLNVAVDYVTEDGTYHDGNTTAVTIAASGRKILRWNPGTTGGVSSGTIGELLGMSGTTTAKDMTMIAAQALYIKDYKANV